PQVVPIALLLLLILDATCPHSGSLSSSSPSQESFARTLATPAIPSGGLGSGEIRGQSTTPSVFSTPMANALPPISNNKTEATSILSSAGSEVCKISGIGPILIFALFR